MLRMSWNVNKHFFTVIIINNNLKIIEYVRTLLGTMCALNPTCAISNRKVSSFLLLVPGGLKTVRYKTFNHCIHRNIM